MSNSKPNHPPPAFSVDRYLQALRKNQVSVWRESETRWQPIPAAVTPVTVPKKEWNELAADARHIMAAFLPLHDWLQQPAQQPLFHLLYDSLSPFEQQGAQLDAKKNWGHATIRFDLFWHNGALKVIEANCTIPAMQAYSDLTLNAWFQAGGTSTSKQASNTEELLQSLLSLYQRDTQTSTPRTIGILHRPGDSQLAELHHYEMIWQQSLPDSKVFRIHPDDIQSKNNRLIDSRTGHSIDLLYRHCFGWRLANHKALTHALLHNQIARIYNPLSAHFEIKAFLALLSHASQDPKWAASIGLSSDQINAIHKRVPTTRIITQQLPTLLSQHAAITDDIFEKHIEDFVIKKSIGYGGHQVIMGSEWYDPSIQARLAQDLLSQTAAANAVITPKIFLNWLNAQSGDLWIVQDRMSGRMHRTKMIQSDDSISEINGFVDASIFLNTGHSSICSGGVSRIATGPVVNIGTGGGLAPFLIE